MFDPPYALPDPASSPLNATHQEVRVHLRPEAGRRAFLTAVGGHACRPPVLYGCRVHAGSASSWTETRAIRGVTVHGPYRRRAAHPISHASPRGTRPRRSAGSL